MKSKSKSPSRPSWLSYVVDRLLIGRDMVTSLASKPSQLMLLSQRRKLNKITRRNIFRANLSGNIEILEGRAMMATLASWDFTGENTALATSTAEVTGANLDVAGSLTRGPGAVASSAGNSFRTTGFQNNGISTANTDYFQTTLSASPGFTLSLNTLDARVAGTASFTVTPGVSSQFAYSLDGTTFTLIGSPSVTVGTPATLPTISLSGITALQNLPDTTTVTLRYYASGQTSTGGWGFNSPSLGTNGFVIDGSVASAGVSAPIVGSPTSASIAITTATLGGNVTSDGGATVTERGVVYSLTADNANPLISGAGVTKVTAAGTTGVFTAPITGLTANSPYSFKAYATNSQGTTYTSVATFSTLAALVAPTVTSPTSTGVTHNAATLGGNVTADGGSPITERGVVYALTETNASPQIGGAGVTVVTSAGTTGVFTAPVTGLTALSGYSYVAYATNAIGTTYTSVATFTTLATPVAPTVTSPTSTAVTSNAATLGGNVTADGNATITARGVVYALTSVNANPQIGGTGVTNVTGTGTTGVFTVSATGLTGTSGYTFAAYATNSVGTTYSPVGTFTTLTAPTGWDFGTTNDATVAPPSASPVNVTLSNLTRGNPNFATTDALIRTNSPSSGYAGATGSGNATVAAVGGVLNTASSAYFEFTVTPNVGFQTALTEISFGSRSTSSGPLNYTIRSSFDSFVADLGSGTFLANSAYALKTTPLASTTSTNAAPVTYRIYGFGGSSPVAVTTQAANWRIDDLLLTSTTSPFVLASPTITVTAPSATYTGLAYAGASSSVSNSSLPAPVVSFTYYTGTTVSPETLLPSAPINVGTYTVVGSSPANGGNNAATSDPVTFSITTASLLLMASNASKVYGEVYTSVGIEGTGFTSGGLVNGETVGSVTLTSAGSPATASVTGSAYMITPSAATGGTFTASNYDITYANGFLSVTAAPLTITADAKSKFAGDADPTFTYTTSAFVNGETAGTVLSGSLSRAPGQESVGTYTIEQGTLIALDGNYEITYVPALLTINPAPVAPTLILTTVNGTDSFLNPAQRSQVTSLVLTFSGPVTIAENAFTVANIGLITSPTPAALGSGQIIVTGSGTPEVTLRWGAGTGVVTRSGSGSRANSLADGNWVLSIDSSKVTATPLTGGLPMTGNTQFGAVPTDNFFRLYGDSNGDGIVNGTDSTAMRAALAAPTSNAAFDWDGNGSTSAGVDTSNSLTNFNKRRRTNFGFPPA